MRFGLRASKLSDQALLTRSVVMNLAQRFDAG